MNDKVIAITIKAQDDASRVISGVERNLAGSSNRISDYLENATSASRRFAVGLTLVGAAVGALGIFGVNSAKELQSAQQSMEVLSGSASDAHKALGQLYSFVLGKPITFPDAAAAAKTLMGYGVTVKDTVPDVEALAKISVVTGGNLQDMALAFGQVNARGKLMGQEVLQLVNDSVPVIKILATHFHESLAQVQTDLNDGKISAADFNAAMTEYANGLDISKFGNTLQNRLISLRGSLRAFAFDLLGIKIDPINGFVVQANGLFDLFSRAVEGAAVALRHLPEVLSMLQPYLPAIAGLIVGALIPAFGGLAVSIWATLAPLLPFMAAGAALGFIINQLAISMGGWSAMLATVRNALASVWAIVGPILIPAFSSLWSTITSQLIPALQLLWTQVGPILGPSLRELAVVAGAVLVVAIYALANAVRSVIGVLSLLIDVVSRVISVLVWFWQTLLSVTSGIRGAVAAGVSGVYGILVGPFEAAARDIEGIIGRIRGAVSAVTGFGGKISSTLHAAHIPGFATGGYTGSGGMNEIAGIVHKGEYVIPQSGVNQATGLPKGVGGDQSVFNMYGNINLGSADAVDRFFERLNTQKEMANLGVGV